MGDGFAHPCIAPWSLMTIFSNGDAPLCNIDFNNKDLCIISALRASDFLVG